MIKCVKGTLKNKKTGLCEKSSSSSSKRVSSKRKSLKNKDISPILEKIMVADLNITKGTIPENAEVIPIASAISSKSLNSSSINSSSNIDSNEVFYKIKLLNKDKKITEEDIANLNKYLSKFKKGLQIIVKHAPKNKITVEPKIIAELDKIIKLKEKDLPDVSLASLSASSQKSPVKPQSNLFLLFLYKLFQFGKYILFGIINIIKWGVWAFMFKIFQATYILGFRVPQLCAGLYQVNKKWVPSLVSLWGLSASLSTVAVVPALYVGIFAAVCNVMFMYFNMSALYEIFKEYYKIFFVWS
jgi:hypothetical protein